MHKSESNQKNNGYAYNSSEESKTFPMVPDEIHKVPESIRKAIKVGKYRKNINVNVNANYNYYANNKMSMGNQFEDEQEDNQKDPNGLHVRQIFGFLDQAVKANKANDINAMEEANSEFMSKETATSKFYKSEGSKNTKISDRMLYARKKLSPLKKGLSV